MLWRNRRFYDREGEVSLHQGRLLTSYFVCDHVVKLSLQHHVGSASGFLLERGNRRACILDLLCTELVAQVGYVAAKDAFRDCRIAINEVKCQSAFFEIVYI